MKPLDKEHTQRTRRTLAERGVEMTPDEVDAHRKAAYETIRREMRAKGYEMPDDDVELFKLIAEVHRNREMREKIREMVKRITGSDLD